MVFLFLVFGFIIFICFKIIVLSEIFGSQLLSKQLMFLNFLRCICFNKHDVLAYKHISLHLSPKDFM